MSVMLHLQKEGNKKNVKGKIEDPPIAHSWAVEFKNRKYLRQPDVCVVFVLKI